MRRRLVATVLVVGCCALALALTGAAADDPRGSTYWVVFDNVFGLVEGGDLKVGGVKAGETTAFKLTDDQPYRVAVEIRLTEPGLTGLRRDARCAVRQQSLIGEYYVDCQPGTGEPLPDGGTVPVEQTSSTIPIDLVSNVMRLPYRDRFRLIINELGVGLAGRPDDLSEVIRRAHPGLRETSRTLAILADQNRQIRQFIARSDAVAQKVEPRRRDLSRWAAEASRTASIQASRADSLQAQWERLPVFLAELQPTLAQLDATGRRQIPALEALGDAAPELDRFLTEAEPFADAGRDSNAELSHTAEAGIDALDESREEVAKLRDLAPEAPKLGQPLRQFLQSIDDRQRSTENDPGVAALAPPAPDKTAYRDGRGLTGMEAFWNYVYGQALATNAFDEIGHVLRIVLLRDTRCSPHSSNPTEDDLARCGSFLGPYQPGVENAKGQLGRFDFGPADDDPTEDPEPKAASKRGGARGGEVTGDSGGQPGRPARARPSDRAPPQAGSGSPGQDGSVLDRVLDTVRGRKGPADDGGGDLDPLLDFLLAP
jgi:virulence factor Mce-like protein